MANEFWMSDRQWAVFEPLIPMNRRGVKPKRNREVISGILHVPKAPARAPRRCGIGQHQRGRRQLLDKAPGRTDIGHLAGGPPRRRRVARSWCC
jgi:hypothetical protein